MAGVILWVTLAGCRCANAPPEPALPFCDGGSCLDVHKAIDAEEIALDARSDGNSERSLDAGDALPPPVWASNSWRLPDRATDAGAPSFCEDLTPVTTWVHANNGTSICLLGQSLFIDAQSNTFRLDMATGRSTIVLGHGSVEVAGRIRCGGGQLFGALMDDHWHSAVLRFEHFDTAGRVLWRGNDGVPLDPAVGGGFFEFVATDQLLAWIFIGGPRGPQLYVSGTQGEDVRTLAEGELPYDLRASGDRLVYVSGGDLWLYTRSTRALENLTRDAAAQWHPWLSGDHLVWMDQRDNPGFDHWNPNNPEVYYMNLRDRVPVRITNDPPTRPVHQYGPVTDGRWIVWADYRNNATPNVMATDGEANIYGYRLDERREQLLVGGRHRMYLPTIVNGDLYVACGAPVTGPGVNPPIGLHRMRLP